MPHHTKDSLGDRMKGYENITRTYLTRRIPVIIRVDGKAFHSFTRGFDRPFDDVLSAAMQNTMKGLCENIQGCVLGYTQSDEITLVLTDYATIRTNGWFDYNIQKMVSVSASLATMIFNKEFHKIVNIYTCENKYPDKTAKEYNDLISNYNSKIGNALFDSRVFSIPKDEVCNCLIWRQQDATRNSIEMLGRSHFSHNQLHKKNCNMIQDMLFKEKSVNWNDIPTKYKRGSCCIRKPITEEIDDPRNPGNKLIINRNAWAIDNEIPIFTQDRDYIEKLL